MSTENPKLVENQVNKGGRPLKAKMFEKERIELLNKLLNYLGITQEKREFYIEDIEADKTLQINIENLGDEVKKYFNYGNWPFFAQPKDKKQRWLSLTKSILKAMKIKIKRGHIKDSFKKKTVKTGYILEN